MQHASQVNCVTRVVSYVERHSDMHFHETHDDHVNYYFLLFQSTTTYSHQTLPFSQIEHFHLLFYPIEIDPSVRSTTQSL